MKFSEIRDGLQRILNKACVARLDDPDAQNAWMCYVEDAYDRGDDCFEVPSQFTKDGNLHVLYF